MAKNFLIIALVLIFNTFTNCKEVDTSNDKIIGKYYVLDFSDASKKGFTLLNKKPETLDIVYEFNFLKNGKIIVNDLSEFYDCGNGILIFNESNWKKTDDNEYEIIINGEYAGESKFKSISKYSLKVEEKKKYLKLESKEYIKNLASYLTD